MNIAFYIPVLNIGGAEKVIINLLKQLSKNRGDNYFLITDERKSTWIMEIDEEVILLNVDSDKNIINRLLKIRKLIKLNNLDLIVSHLTHANIHCLLLKKVCSVKLVIVEHSITSLYIESLNRLSFQICKVLIRNLYNSANLIVCVSKICKKDLVEKFSIKDFNCKVIYNPIDFDSIKSLSTNLLSKEIDDFIGMRKLIVSVGRLEKIKNHLFLINSIKNYLVYNNIVLVIIGDGSERNRLQKFIYENSLQEHILLIGYERNPYKFIARSSLLVHPSKFEGFGLVLIESLFLCIPVISNNFEAAYEILKNGEFGSIFDDEKSLIETLDFELNRQNKLSIMEISDKLHNIYNSNVIANIYQENFHTV